MNTSNKILIIEDDIVDYRHIFNGLSTYDCYPKNEDFESFKMHLRGWLEGHSDDRIKQAKEYFDIFLGNKDFVAIILDIKLLEEKKDKSGLVFIEFLRNHYFPLIPIVMLSSLPARDVRPGLTEASGMANYYLHKSSEEGRLSSDFFKNQLKPVLSMLITWHTTNSPEKIIKQVSVAYTKEILEYLDDKFGLAEEKLDLVCSTAQELREFAAVNLGVLRYHVKINNKNAGKLADSLIAEFGLTMSIPKLEKYRKPILEGLKASKDEIANILKGESKKEITDYLKKIIRDKLGCDEDDPVLEEALITLVNFLRKNFKLLMFI